MRYFKVRNFENFQHYRDRKPPWIKVYSDLLRDTDIALLPDSAKWHLVGIWILASQVGNRLPVNNSWIAGQINAESPVDLDLLIKHNFLILLENDEPCKQDASKSLAKCSESAIHRDQRTENKTSSNEALEEEPKRSPLKTTGKILGGIRADYKRFQGWTETAVSWAGAVFRAHPKAPVEQVEKSVRAVLNEMPEKLPYLKSNQDFYRVANGKLNKPWVSEKEQRWENEKARLAENDMSVGAVLADAIKRGEA